METKQKLVLSDLKKIVNRFETHSHERIVLF